MVLLLSLLVCEELCLLVKLLLLLEHLLLVVMVPAFYHLLFRDASRSWAGEGILVRVAGRGSVVDEEETLVSWSIGVSRWALLNPDVAFYGGPAHYGEGRAFTWIDWGTG